MLALSTASTLHVRRGHSTLRRPIQPDRTGGRHSPPLTLTPVKFAPPLAAGIIAGSTFTSSKKLPPHAIHRSTPTASNFRNRRFKRRSLHQNNVADCGCRDKTTARWGTYSLSRRFDYRCAPGPKSGQSQRCQRTWQRLSLFAAGELLRDHADLKLEILNRGISGNKVPDLAARWQTDCLDLQPTVLSILIGVNDIWHKLNGNYSGTVEDYANGYRKLIEDTQSKLPETRIVICEPFVLKCGAVNDKWFPEFDERREVAVKLAKEMKLTLVPFSRCSIVQ